MSDSVSILKMEDADRRLLLKLQQRLLTTPQPFAQPAEHAESRRLELVFSLAPMVLAFLYLMVLTVFIFR